MNSNNQRDLIEPHTPDSFMLEQDIFKLSNMAAQLVIDIEALEKHSSDTIVALASMQFTELVPDESLLSKYDQLESEELNKQHLAEIIPYIKELIVRKKELIQKRQEVEAYLLYIQQQKALVNKFFDNAAVANYLKQIKSQPLELQEKFLITFIKLIDKKGANGSRKGSEKAFASFYDKKTNTHLLEQLAFSCGLRQEQPLTTDSELNILGHRWKFLTKIIELCPPLPEVYIKTVLESKLNTEKEFFKDFYQSSHLEKFLVFFKELSSHVNLSDSSNQLVKNAVIDFLKKKPSQSMSALEPILQNLNATLDEVARLEKRLQKINASLEHQHDPQAQLFLKNLRDTRESELQSKKNQAVLMLNNMKICFDRSILQPYSCSEEILKLLADSLNAGIQDREIASEARTVILSIAEIAQSFQPAQETGWSTTQLYSLRTLASNLIFETGPWTADTENLLLKIGSIAQKSQSIILQNFLTAIASYQSRLIKLDDLEHRKYLYVVMRELATAGLKIDTQRTARLLAACCEQNQHLSPDKIIEIYREIKSDIGCADQDVPEEFLLLLRKFQDKNPMSGKEFAGYYQKLTPSERENLIPVLLDQTDIKTFDDFYHVVTSLTPEEYTQLEEDSILSTKYPFLKIQQHQNTPATFMATELVTPPAEEIHLWLRATAESPLSEKSITLYQEMLMNDELTEEQKKFFNAYFMTAAFIHIHTENPPQTNCDLEEPIYSIVQKMLSQREPSQDNLMAHVYALRSYIHNTPRADLQEACGLWAKHIEYKIDALNLQQNLQVVFELNATPEDYEKAKDVMLISGSETPYLPQGLSSLQYFCDYIAQIVKSNPEHSTFLFQSYLELLANPDFSLDAEKVLVLQRTFDLLLQNSKNPLELKSQIMDELHKISQSNPTILDLLHPLIDSIFKDEKKYSEQLFQTFFKDTSALRDYQKKVAPLFMSLPQEESVLSFAKREFISHLMRGSKSHISANTLLTLIKNVYSDSSSSDEYHPEHIAAYRNIVRQNIPIKSVADKIKYIKSFVFDSSISDAMRAQLFEGSSLASGIIELLVKDKDSEFDKIIELQKVLIALLPKKEGLSSYYEKVKSSTLGGASGTSEIPQRVLLELNNLLKQQVQEYISENKEKQSAYLLSQKQQESFRLNKALGATWDSALELSLPDFLRYDLSADSSALLEPSKLASYLSAHIQSHCAKKSLDIQKHLQSLSLQQFYSVCDSIQKMEHCPVNLQSVFLDRSQLQQELLIGQISSYALTDDRFKNEVDFVLEKQRQENIQFLLNEATKLTAEKIISPAQALEILSSFDKNIETNSLKRIIEKRYLSESEIECSQSQLSNSIQKEISQLQALQVAEPYRSFWSGLIIDKINLLHERNQLSAQTCEQYLNSLPSNIEDIGVIRSRMFLAETLHRTMIPADKLYERLLTQINKSAQEDSIFISSPSLFELQYILGRLREYPFIEKVISEQNIEADFSDRAAIIIATIQAYSVDDSDFKEKVQNLEKELLEYKLKSLYDDVMGYSKSHIFNAHQLFSLFSSLPEQYCTESVAITLEKIYEQSTSELLAKSKNINEALHKEISDITSSGVTEPFISLWAELLITKLSLLQEKGLLSEQSHYALLRALPEELDSDATSKRNQQLLETARKIFLKENASNIDFINEIQTLYLSCGYQSSNFAEYLLEDSTFTEHSSNSLVNIHQVLLTSLDDPESLYHVSQSAVLIHIKDFYSEHLIADGLIALQHDIAKLKMIYAIDSSVETILRERLVTLEQSANQLAKLYPQQPETTTNARSPSSKKLFGNGLSSPSQKTKEAIEKLKKDILNSTSQEESVQHVFDFIQLTLNNLHPSQKTQLTTMLKASLAFEILEKVSHNQSVTRRNNSLEIIFNHSSMSSLTLEQKKALTDRAEMYKNNAKENKSRPLSREKKELYLEEIGQEIIARLKAIDMIFKMQNGSYNSQETQSQKDFIDVAEHFNFDTLNPGMLIQKKNQHLSRAPHDRVYDITDTFRNFNSREILTDEQHRQNIQKNKILYLDGLPLLFSLDTFLTDFLDRRDFEKDLEILRGESVHFTQDGDSQIPYIAMLHYRENEQRQQFFENIRQAAPHSELSTLKPILMIYDIEKSFEALDKSDHISALLDNFSALIEKKGFPPADIHIFQQSIQELRLPVTSTQIIQILNKCSFFDYDEHSDLKENIATLLSMQSLKIYKDYLMAYPLDKENRPLLNDFISEYELNDFEKGKAIKLPTLAARYAQKNPDSDFSKAWNEGFTRLYVETSGSQELSGLSFQACANILQRVQLEEKDKTPLADRLYHNHPWIESIAFSLPQKFDAPIIPAWISSVADVIRTSYENMYSMLTQAASLVKKITQPSFFTNASAKDIGDSINQSYQNLDTLFNIFANSNKVAKKLSFITSPSDMLARDHELSSRQEFLSLNYEMAETLAHIQHSIEQSSEKTTLQNEKKIKAVLDAMIDNLSNPEYILKILSASQPRVIEKTIVNSDNQQVIITQKFANNDLLQGLHASLTQLVSMSPTLYHDYQPALNDLLGGIIVACQSFSEKNSLSLDLSYFQEPYLEFWKKSLELCDGRSKAPQFPSQESCLQLQQLYHIIMKSKGNDSDKDFFRQQTEHFYYNFVSEIINCVNTLENKHPINQKTIAGELKNTLKGLILSPGQIESFRPSHEQVISLQKLDIQTLPIDTETQLLLQLLSRSPQSQTQLCESYIKMWSQIAEDYTPSTALYINHEQMQALLLTDKYIQDSLEASELTQSQRKTLNQAILDSNQQYNAVLEKIILLCCDTNLSMQDLKDSLDALDALLSITESSSSFKVEEHNKNAITRMLKPVLEQSSLPIELMADNPYLLMQLSTKLSPEEILTQINSLLNLVNKQSAAEQIKEALIDLLGSPLPNLENLSETLFLIQQKLPSDLIDNEVKLLISLNLCGLDNAENLYNATLSYLRVWAEQYQKTEGPELNAATIKIIFAAHNKLELLLTSENLSPAEETHLRTVLRDANEHYNQILGDIIQKCCVARDNNSFEKIKSSFIELESLLALTKNSEFLKLNLANFELLKGTTLDICQNFDISFESFSEQMPALYQELTSKNKESGSMKYEDSPTGVEQFPDHPSITSGAYHIKHKAPKITD